MMPYTLTTLDNEAISVASLSGSVDAADLVNVFSHGCGWMRQFTTPTCLLIDFRSVHSLKQAASSMQLEQIRSELNLTRSGAPRFFAFISDDPAINSLAKDLSDPENAIFVFETVESAHSYVNLKVGSVMLKQTLESLETNEFEHTKELSADILMGDPKLQALLHRTVTPFPIGGVLRLVAVSLQKDMLVFPEQDVIIGRRERGKNPDVDLSLWGGFFSGVSREHARINIEADGFLYVYDLGSTNGTYINEIELNPHEGYRLSDSDVVRFGKLNVQVFFQRAK
jgi:hypothetical protein